MTTVLEFASPRRATGHPDPLLSASPARDSQADCAPISVLVADDTPNVLALLVALIGDHPLLEVTATADNGAAALSLAAQLRPQLVVLDVSMPVMHGLEAAARLRELYPEMRIVMTAADDDPGLRQAYLDVGADCCIRKFYFARQLPATVETLFPERRISPAEAARRRI